MRNIKKLGRKGAFLWGKLYSENKTFDWIETLNEKDFRGISFAPAPYILYSFPKNSKHC